MGEVLARWNLNAIVPVEEEKCENVATDKEMLESGVTDDGPGHALWRTGMAGGSAEVRSSRCNYSNK